MTKKSGASKPPFDPATLREGMAIIFDQAQVSAANHRKNTVALYKLHLSAASITLPGRNGNTEQQHQLVGEDLFGDVFIELTGRVLVVKKGSVVGDRTVKFLGSYAKYINDKTSEEKAKHPQARDEDDEDETLASRFFTRLLQWLFDGFLAKNKIVRYRTVQVVAEMISHLGELDEDTYTILRSNLMNRVYDKESIIRAHATIALSKLVGSEDPGDVPTDEPSILITLLEVLCCDPAPEVRRAALLNIPLTAETLDVLLSRTRDTDPLTRKLVYSTVLQSRLTHPRQLTIAQREQVVKHGLGDREPVVRLAAGKLVACWLDAVMQEEASKEQPEGDGEGEGATTWDGDDGGVMKGLIAFLRIFDVVGPGEEVAVDALLSIFVTRPTYLDVFAFSPPYWRELTAESAVLARVFIEHCMNTGDEARLESASTPVVTEFAFHVQEMYNVLLRLMQEEAEARVLEGEDEQERDDREEMMMKTEVVLGELLKIAVNLDFADEIGRRKMLAVVRDMLAHPQLPESLITKCMDILKVITPSERELIRIVVEIIIELRDEDDVADFLNPDATTSFVGGDSQSDITHSTLKRERSMVRTKARDEMSPEEVFAADVIDLRCLALCIAMLERVHGDFDDNSTLQGILSDLIIPSVKRKELVVREKGLMSLGLCCLIAKNMALSSFQLFLGQVQQSPVDLRLKVLQLVFDLLVMYEQEFFGRPEIAERIVTFLLQTLETDESPVIQAVLSIGVSKLLLAGFVEDHRVLTSLVLVYVSPATADNPELRQCLSYFFPVYCYSSPDNQNRLRSIFMTAFDQVVKVHEELEEGQEMITPHQFGLLLVDWMDPEKTAAAQGTSGTKPRNTHVDLAVDLLKAFYDDDRTADQLKVLSQLLGQLSLTPEVGKRSVYKIGVMLYYLQERRLIDNSAIEKVITRFRGRFEKAFAKDLVDLDPAVLEEEDFSELFEYIGAEPARYLKQVERERAKRSSIDGDNEATVEGGDVSDSGADSDAGGSAKPKSRTKKAGKKSARSQPRSKSRAVMSTSSSDSASEDEDRVPQASEDEDGASSTMSPRGSAEPSPPTHQINAKPESPGQEDDSLSEGGIDTDQDEGTRSEPSDPQRPGTMKVAKRQPSKLTARSRTQPKTTSLRKQADKSSDQDSEAEEDAASEEEPPIAKPSQQRVSKQPGASTRSRARPKPQEKHRSSGDSEKEQDPRTAHSQPMEVETPSSSGAEEPVPHVTPMKKQSKRLRSPSAKQALASPAHKRRVQRSATSRSGAHQTKQDNLAQEQEASEEESSNNSNEEEEEIERSPSPTPVKRVTRRKNPVVPEQPPTTQGRGRGRGRARGSGAQTGRGRGRGKAEPATAAARTTRQTRSSKR